MTSTAIPQHQAINAIDTQLNRLDSVFKHIVHEPLALRAHIHPITLVNRPADTTSTKTAAAGIFRTGAQATAMAVIAQCAMHMKIAKIGFFVSRGGTSCAPCRRGRDKTSNSTWRRQRGVAYADTEAATLAA